MLVRELIEQLSEMPPELPVYFCLMTSDAVKVDGAARAQFQNGPYVSLYADTADLDDMWRDYVMDRLDRAV